MSKRFFEGKQSKIFQAVTFVVGGFFSFFVFKLTGSSDYWKDFLLPGVSPLAQGLLVWMTTTVVGLWSERLFFDNELKRQIDALPESIRAIIPKDFLVTDQGTINNAFPELKLKLETADSVWNTCVMVLSEQENDFANYTRRWGPDIIKAASLCVNGGGTWRDILSKNIAVKRVDEIRGKIGERQNSYQPKVLKSPMALLNFVVIKPKQMGELKEVYFGFGLHDFDPDARIFSTKNPSIVETFERMFLLLEHDFSAAFIR